MKAESTSEMIQVLNRLDGIEADAALTRELAAAARHRDGLADELTDQLASIAGRLEEIRSLHMESIQDGAVSGNVSLGRQIRQVPLGGTTTATTFDGLDRPAVLRSGTTAATVGEVTEHARAAERRGLPPRFERQVRPAFKGRAAARPGCSESFTATVVLRERARWPNRSYRSAGIPVGGDWIGGSRLRR